ncbi:pentapeptide repeat-containing protein [Crocosphaera sp. UHCC 0190]|uniref:pentapeptide repeat-containing protein n=1 Tax=Crocosphaera sp. UHCC 0190 TaxID=3110246 RepID=UPI002B22188D|nr:pentapeptide repeat-containing protein [Crocosphaera sp. UHCC 0190]MEA5509992.1 pentapeptide repeat-containing protein [Crocosphaera sp. UHCC 0190]
MANPQHFALLTSHLEAWNQWRKQNPEIIPDLQGANLSNHNLRGVNLIGANLEKAIFYGTDLSCARLTKANLRHSDFTSAICFEGIFDEADLSYSYLTQADFSQAFLSKANLYGVYFIEAYLVDANLKNANLEKADLSNAYLTGANLTGANLQDANFSGSDLTGTQGLKLTSEDSRFMPVYSADFSANYLNKNTKKTLDKLSQKRENFDGKLRQKTISTAAEFSRKETDINFQEMTKEIEKLRLENTRLKVQLYDLSEERFQLINEINQLKKADQTLIIANAS